MSLPSLRELGKTGVKIPAIGLGCMNMSSLYGAADEQENIKILNRAIELGCTFWDTADMYGDNEILLSKVLKEHRNEVFLCTKFAFLQENGEIKVSGKPEYVRQACENSLKRLGIDYIDLYYQHRVDPNTPIEDTVGALAELVKEGKVKYIGLSEFPRFQGENFNKNLELVQKFNEFASKKGITTGQLCLAWVIGQGENFVTIPGTKRLKYLEENFEARNIHLSPEELSEIRKIIDSIEIAGERYDENLAKFTDK
ncbi:Aldo/keto reductase [Rhizophagus irregularis]|uniref:Aldo/keto reductase n=1 Tax=Rhizophagus irregularis TaxID=588596 RepID=A0A2I1HL31_9GLOM|nr:Aldo/keto reductase [Rhizophagus irregularis]